MNRHRPSCAYAEILFNSFLSIVHSLLSTSVPLTQETEQRLCLHDLNNASWHASPVGVQWLEAPPIALTGLTELLTELSLSVTLLRKKRIGTMEPQLVITTCRVMGLCLSPSPLEPFEGTP